MAQRPSTVVFISWSTLIQESSPWKGTAMDRFGEGGPPYFSSFSRIRRFQSLSFGRPAPIIPRGGPPPGGGGGGAKSIGPLPSAISFSRLTAILTGRKTPAGPAFGMYFF